MRAINFVIAAFLFGLGWITMTVTAAVVILAVVFCVLERFGTHNPYIPDAGLIALIIPITFCTYLGMSAMGYAKHLIVQIVKYR